MMRRHIEEFEIGQIIFNVAAAVNLKPEIGKGARDESHHLRGNMQPAAANRSARKRDIEAIRLETAFKFLTFQQFLTRLFQTRQFRLDSVDRLTERWAFFARQATDLFELKCELAFVPQKCRVPGGKVLRRGTCFQFSASLRFEGSQFLQHAKTPPLYVSQAHEEDSWA